MLCQLIHLALNVINQLLVVVVPIQYHNAVTKHYGLFISLYKAFSNAAILNDHKQEMCIVIGLHSSTVSKSVGTVAASHSPRLDHRSLTLLFFFSFYACSYDSVRIEGRALFSCSNSFWVKIMVSIQFSWLWLFPSVQHFYL